MIQIDYRPHPSQQVIHDALRPALSGKIVMCITGRRFGKTVLAINEIVMRALEQPGARIWYVAPTKEQAHGIAWRLMLYERREKDTWKKLPPYMPPEMIKKKREDKYFVELTNGSLIEFKGTQDPVFLLGHGLHFVVFDEFHSISHSVWEDDVRPMLNDWNGDALFIGTLPDPKVHSIDQTFLDMYEDFYYGKNLFEEDGRAFNFTSFENPHLNAKKVESHIESLKRKGREKDAERLYFGKYSRERGLVFPKFSYDVHTCEPIRIQDGWMKVMALDPHPQKPFNAVWGALDPRDHFWFYREKEFVTDGGRPKTVNEIAYDIMESEAVNKESVKLRLIDPTFAKVQLNVIGQRSIKDLFRENGMFFREADREFFPFFEKFTDMLVDFPEPTVHITRNCPGLIRQLQRYSWESWGNARARAERGEKNKPKKVDDDYIDCIKYIINTNIAYPKRDKIERHKRHLRDRWEKQHYL